MSLTAEKISEQNLGIRYLQGELTEEQQVEFENFLMENPEYINELEMLKVFSENLAEANQPNAQTTVNRKLSIFQIFGGIAFGAIASIMLYLGMDTNTTAFEVSEVYYLETMRSSGQGSAVIKLPESSKYILITVPLNPDQSGEINVELINSTSEELVLALKNLNANSMGEIAFSIQGRILKVGEYELNIIDENNPFGSNSNVLELIVKNRHEIKELKGDKFDISLKLLTLLQNEFETIEQ